MNHIVIIKWCWHDRCKCECHTYWCYSNNWNAYWQICVYVLYRCRHSLSLLKRNNDWHRFFSNDRLSMNIVQERYSYHCERISQENLLSNSNKREKRTTIYAVRWMSMDKTREACRWHEQSSIAVNPMLNETRWQSKSY
jgi:hypothetical protein